nr:hypothetical protein C16C8.15 - Caenorhabditis elegans [Caenorhabditis elegans]
MSGPSDLMSEFRKLRVEASKIQNEFKEIPSSADHKLIKETLEMSQKILKKQDQFQDEMKQEFFKHNYKIKQEFQKIQEKQNKLIENLMSELKTVKAELNVTKNQINGLLAKNSDENLELILESIWIIHKRQDQMMMMNQQGETVHF